MRPLLPAAVLMLACAPKAEPEPTPQVPNLVPSTSWVLMDTPLADPSPYVGRFLPDDGEPSLGSAFKTACSAFITGAEQASQGRFSERLAASSGFVVKKGEQDLGRDVLDKGTTTVLHVEADLAALTVGDIADPAGFRDCCLQAEDQCSSRYLGAFIKGTGWVEYAFDEDGVMDKSGDPYIGDDSVSIRHGMAWRRATDFDDAYFAFEAHSARVPDPPWASWSCDSPDPPHDPMGEFFVGESPMVDALSVAKDQARADARTQVVEWLGERIRTGSITLTLTGGDVSDLTTGLADAKAVERAASAVAAFVKDKKYACVEPIQRGDPLGHGYQVKVLMMLPADLAEQAAAQVLEAAR